MHKIHFKMKTNKNVRCDRDVILWHLRKEKIIFCRCFWIVLLLFVCLFVSMLLLLLLTVIKTVAELLLQFLHHKCFQEAMCPREVSEPLNLESDFHSERFS